MQINSAIRALLGATAVAAAFAVSAPVMAQATTVTVGPGGTFTATGAGAITKGTTTISCTVHFSGNLVPGSYPATANDPAGTFTGSSVVGSVTASSFTAGSPLCVSSSSVNLPWNVVATGGTYTAPRPATAHTVNLTFGNTSNTIDLRNTSIGDCVGNITGVLNTSTNTIVIQAQAMTGVNPATACHLHGPGTSDNANPISLTLSPSTTVTVN
jgi:hypothetical protein